MFQQIIVNSFVTAAQVALVGLGFALVYRVCRFINFSHGVVFTAGAYFMLSGVTWMRLPLFFSIPLGIALSSLLGCLLNTAVYRPLRNKEASSLVLLLSSLGVYIIVQNVLSLIYGDDIITVGPRIVREGITVLGAKITSIQLATLCVCVAVVVIVAILLRRTRIGLAIRAVANDEELATISGIESSRIATWVFALGSGLAGCAGILVALDIGMTPTMGMNILMMGIVAAIIGGMGSIVGIGLGALLLGFGQNVASWGISSHWRDATAFVILFAFLLIRPEGFGIRRGGQLR